MKILKELIVANVVSLDTLTLIGHSLGAHTASILATLFWLEQQKLKRRPNFGQIYSLLTANNSMDVATSSNEVSNSNDSTGLIAVLIALDPAGPEYRDIEVDNGIERLRHGRAAYTMVIHTNSFYGLTDRVGDADFYPNGGRYQWNCIRRSKPNIFQRLGT